jgi:hypothetical protein
MFFVAGYLDMQHEMRGKARTKAHKSSKVCDLVV